MNMNHYLPKASGWRNLLLLGICVGLLSACTGLGLPTNASLPGQRPLPTLAAPPTALPGKVQVVTPNAASLATQPPGTPSITTAPGSNVKVTGTITTYDAVKMISTFGTQVLGVTVSVPRASGVTGEISLPQAAKSSVNAAVNVAGQVAAGTIGTEKGLSGMAQVALGKGKVSGDMNMDITSASLGAFSFISKAPAPTSSAQALSLVKQTFPALGSMMLSESSSSGGMYVFEGNANKLGQDWKSRQTTMLATRVVAGAGKVGPDVFVWAMVANGELATVR